MYMVILFTVKSSRIVLLKYNSYLNFLCFQVVSVFSDSEFTGEVLFAWRTWYQVCVGQDNVYSKHLRLIRASDWSISAAAELWLVERSMVGFHWRSQPRGLPENICLSWSLLFFEIFIVSLVKHPATTQILQTILQGAK